MTVLPTTKESRSLGHQAFSVFCNTLAKEAASKNESFRSENEELGRQMCVEELQSLRIFWESKEVANIDVASIVAISDDADDITGIPQLVYPLKDHLSVPHNEMHHFCVTIAGVLLVPVRVQSLPRFKFDDEKGTVQVNFRVNPFLMLSGTLENYSGTIEDMKEEVQRNAYHGYFQGFDPGSRCWEGSSFVMSAVKIGKHGVLASLAQENEPEAEGFEEDLRLAAESIPNHQFLHQAADDTRALSKSNQKLRLAEDVFQTLALWNPYEGPLFQFKLEDGVVGKLLSGEPSLRVEPKGKTTVLLSSLSNLHVTLANIPVCFVPYDPIFVQYGAGFVLRYNGLFHTAEAVFFFDENASDLIREGDFRARVELTLRPPYYRTQMTGANGEPLDRLDDLPVRFVFLQLELSDFRSRMKKLGIEVQEER